MKEETVLNIYRDDKDLYS